MRLSFSRRERLHDDARLVPSIRAVPVASVNSTCRPSGSTCGPCAIFTVLDAHEHVRCAAIRGDPHDALAALAEHDAIRPPAHAERVVGRANRDGGTARDGNSLERLIGGS